MTATKKTGLRKNPLPKPERHPYSVKFREAYGRSLSREEIRLVQAYRGLDDAGATLLLNIGADLVLAQVKKSGRR